MVKIIPIFKGKISNGKLLFEDRATFDKYLLSLNESVEIIVRKPKKLSSHKERKYYWAVPIKMLSDETGASPDDIHNEMKRMFLRIGGEKIPITKSTTELSTVEMEDYLKKIRMWANAELSILIPEPNESEFN